MKMLSQSSKVYAISIVFIVLLVFPSQAQQSEEKPLSSPLRGQWWYVGGEGPGNYTRIQDAIDAASSGDTVFMYHNLSPYYENLEVNQSITLLGENETTTVIDGSSLANVVNVSDNAPMLTKQTDGFLMFFFFLHL
jgi:pectin methylesterase-like acyl-CoA thioesterase